MMEPRKIILIGSAHPLRGGLATFNERLIREYIREGADASIVTFTLQYPSFLFPGKTQFSTEPPPADVPIRIAVNSINPLNWIKVGRAIRAEKPDLVLVKFWLPFMAPCFGTICRIIKTNGVTKVVSIVDNLIPHEPRPGDSMFIRYWVNCVDGFIAMSHAVEKDIVDTLNRKGKNSRIPVRFAAHPLYDNFGDPIEKRLALEQLGLDPECSWVLFFGFIRDYKGLDLLLEAFAHESLHNSNIRLLVAGEFYCDPKPYEEIIRSKNLSDRVVLHTDFIPDSKVACYFSACDLVAQPYKSATQSGVTQIAYHFNKPMIITDVGGLAEIVPDGRVGYVVPPDPDAIADAIVRFYSLKMESAFSAAAAVEKLKYSWSVMTQAINSLLTQKEQT